MKERFDKIWVGVLAGLFGVLAGFLIYTAVWSIWYDKEFSYFIDRVFLGTDLFRDKIVTVSVLFDIFLFALFLRFNWYQFCRGVLLVVLLSVPVIIYYY